MSQRYANKLCGFSSSSFFSTHPTGCIASDMKGPVLTSGEGGECMYTEPNGLLPPPSFFSRL